MIVKVKQNKFVVSKVVYIRLMVEIFFYVGFDI